MQTSSGLGHLTQLHERLQHRGPSFSDAVELLLQGLFLFVGHDRQFVSQVGFDLIERRGRIWMDSDRSIGQHGFRTSSSDGDVRWFSWQWVDHRIANVPEMALDSLVKNLVITDSCLQVRVPIDQPFTAIDQILAEQVKEGSADCSGTDLIECESRTLPVAGASHLLQLTENAGFVLIFPFPDALH